ncbi:coiled-coil domain-containing protein R3HCC1L [Cucurbita pepo subsp. pepo]|uniref:coiled-coil domain-containing protein R3HCC1L n=1 Tax=Cucurbita pepo subsp. pepo TaxID=3664 RepID=UPI000C9D2F86|nr:coiled-coil domain-containing protein R3HCC1L [Cucurbita pepo subsp. pepo]XP_023516773.1 coiled-coil domain-containing protein R3HCC1L [Cucurbita pepo subsp. pepo]XP_023516774.1 coiled-coil domain-containing protein R3HCC1L [Cucurbita pepo subsp. pepo]
MDKEEERQQRRSNWSETVEDLVTAGDTDAAISLLESVISDLQTSENSNPDPQLAAALTDLSALYSSKGFSLKADDIAAKALVLKQQDQVSSPAGFAKIVKEDRTSSATVSLSSHNSVDEASVGTGTLDHTRDCPDNAVPCDDDDWEAIADRPPNELLSLQCEPDKPEILIRETTDQTTIRETTDKTTRRRGRGTFSYKKHELYSDRLSDSSTTNDTKDEDASHELEVGRKELKSAQYGTQHVLVLADFPPSTKTIDLERLLGNFKNSGVVIRWVNDTVALAVFPTPSTALEVLNHVRCPFTIRLLDENDTLLSSVPPRDLEPPKQRPKTSARTAQRLIAQGMGLKLPASTTGFGSKELRKQEEDRRNRIVSRQKLRDEAWGE